MTHAAHDSESAYREMQMRLKLKRIFLKWVWPLARCQFGWLFSPFLGWLDARDVHLYAGFVTGVTGGRLFWPRSHTDPDLWYTLLVCLDYGRGVVGGGDFAFASHGHTLKCEHGDVLVYNGLALHGTTEFALHDLDHRSGRVFFAFYAKRCVLDAALRSKALVERVGPSALVL